MLLNVTCFTQCEIIKINFFFSCYAVSQNTLPFFPIRTTGIVWRIFTKMLNIKEANRPSGFTDGKKKSRPFTLTSVDICL